MKTFVIASFCLVALVSVYGFNYRNKEIKAEEGIEFFTGTWQQALEKAKKENKYIFLDAYASWCGPCKMMKHKTFTDKLVGDFYNKHFICVAMDMEKGEGPTLADKYSVEAYPTLIYFQPDGKLIGKATGFRKSKEFLEMGEQVVAKVK
ncbi:MAG: thioredoxin family protein [Bacteroidota bacterium]|nr:thioredoxin family protein [Bacteroidota bacterium]